jgi:hypothetical protein
MAQSAYGNMAVNELAFCARRFYRVENAILVRGKLGTRIGNFKGGKAVATSSLALFVFSPTWGLLSLAAGLIITLISGYFSLGGVSIPFFFLFPAYFIYGKECFILTVILSLLCFFRHYPYGKNFPAGAGKKTYLLKIIAQKLKK